ncbi:hypothetical protein [Rhizobium leguminosarum]|uniref:hypothetical protein n=1 Tax=Rhizobium leguminosarum TaxID=384 RepID=UPI001FDEAD11|nr:hypothetical protein [Rhizobium leguminosarum]
MCDFVAELVRAANEVDRLTASEIESLLLRAMTTVRELREQAGIPGSDTEHDAIGPPGHRGKSRRHIFPSEYLGIPSRSRESKGRPDVSGRKSPQERGLGRGVVSRQERIVALLQLLCICFLSEQ